MVGVDLAESMQARALSKARAQELENIEFQQVRCPGNALCWPVLALFLKHTTCFTPGHSNNWHLPCFTGWHLP